MQGLKLSLIVFITLSMIACVPPKKFEETNDKYLAALSEMEAQRERALMSEAAMNEQRSEFDRLKKRNTHLAQDTTILGASLRQMTEQYDKINSLNDQLLDKYNKLLSGDNSENRKLLTALESLRLEQQNSQDSLSALSRELAVRSAELEQREAKLKELQTELARQKDAMTDLRSRLSNALLGFEGKGLSIEQRDGKIYVSMENKLLFPSGSAKVDAQGRKALIDLAKAIEKEDGLGVMVEGHTDTDALAPGSAFKDNWDLSVERAVSVVRILQENSTLDPSSITAAGKSQYVPVDPNDKAKNRRIEVVLTPDLSELFKMVKED
jgi:chemotaxis protein MotB